MAHLMLTGKHFLEEDLRSLNARDAIARPATDEDFNSDFSRNYAAEQKPYSRRAVIY